MTNENRLILINQFEILSAQFPDQAEEYTRNITMLKNGFPNEYNSIFSELIDETSMDIIREVNEIITMFRYIRNAKDTLTEEELEQNQEQLIKITFRGFDGNHDDHYFYFKDLVERADDFIDLNNWATNSHSQADLPRYRSMLTEYKAILNDKIYNWGISELIQISNSI